MTVKPVLEYPNDVLRINCAPVPADAIATGLMQQLVTDLVDTMYATPGTVGLAAPQIGEPYRMFVMDATAAGTREAFRVVVNPEPPVQSKWKFGREGCLSFPEYLITIKRARKLTCQHFDPDFNPVTLELQDFEAVIYQHEYDHLNGVLFIDLARNLETDLIVRTV